MFGDILGALGGQLVQIAIASAPGLVTGLIVKHGRRLTNWIPNAAIPVLTLVAGTTAGALAGADPATAAGLGVQTMIGAVGIHQVTKLAVKGTVDRLTKPDGKIGSLLRKIGPGVETSL